VTEYARPENEGRSKCKARNIVIGFLETYIVPTGTHFS